MIPLAHERYPLKIDIKWLIPIIIISGLLAILFYELGRGFADKASANGETLTSFLPARQDVAGGLPTGLEWKADRLHRQNPVEVGVKKDDRASAPQPDFSKIADAVYIAEGGKKAKVPYGILSIPVRDEAHARRICIQSAKNAYKRWQADGSPGNYPEGFIKHWGKRYCPPEAHPKNKYWAGNVSANLNRGER